MSKLIKILKNIQPEAKTEEERNQATTEAVRGVSEKVSTVGFCLGSVQWCVFNNSSLIGIKICQILTHKTKLQSCAKELEWSLFQDSEETIHSAEKNDTSYKMAGFFTEMKQKKIQNGRLRKFKMAA